MKVKSRQELYGKLTPTKKRKKAIDWCMRFLWLDMDSMSDGPFYELVAEYECIVAYPGDIGYNFFATPSVESIEDLPDPDEQMRDVRARFKEFQNAARDLLASFEGMMDQAGKWLKVDKTMQFTVMVGPSGRYSITDEDEHDFEYSYGRQIAQLLKGNKFNDVIRRCPVCGHYFAVLTKHGKQVCSNRCASLQTARKKFDENPVSAKRRRNIETYFAIRKKKGDTEAGLKSSLRRYIRTRGYSPEEIPRYIKVFIDSH